MNDDEGILQLLAEFQDKSQPLGVTVVRVVSETAAARTLADWVSSLGAALVLASAELITHAPGIVAALEAEGLPVRPSVSAAATRDAPAGLSLGRLAIAETGSVLLCEPSLADRSVGMLSRAQAIVCPTSSLVASLDDAVPALRRFAMAPGGSFATLVTGPSRTADIERVLTVGVQGPGKVLVLFVDELPGFA
ncbi:MAG: LutC/YkgG family protein [Thermomicrobiales bacterium]